MSNNELLFPEEAKERAREAFIAGYHKRVGEEQMNEMVEKTANSLFEQWYGREYE